MIKINVITNQIIWKKYIKNPSKFIDRQTRLINKKDNNYKKNILICTLLLSGTKEIRQLNQKFRKKNKSTDILSFPFYEKKHLKKIISKEKKIYLGDIIINLNKINNKKDKKKFKNQFNKLWIHGFFHLLGHSHRLDKEYLKMQKLENKFFNFLK